MALFIPNDEALDIAMLFDDDLQKRGKGRLRKASKYVFADMNLTTLKVPTRQYFKINKKTNTVDLPHNCLQLSSVNVVWCGVEIPVFRTENVKYSDIPEVDFAKDCNCQYKCGYKLCSTIKGYTAVTSVKTDKMPDESDVSFTCVDRRGCDNDGFFYEQLEYPKRIYTDGVWTDTIKFSETNKLCKVEVDNNGCVCDTEANIDALCNACGIANLPNPTIPFGGTADTPPCPDQDTWKYFCNTKLDYFSVQCGCYPIGFYPGCYNVYNISELGDRLIFPPNFGWDKVMVRYYIDIDTNNLQIPFIALDTYIVGLKWWDNRFSTNMERRKLALGFEADYTKLKWGLLLELNKYRLAELRMILTPPVHVPSFLPLNSNGYGGYGGWNGNGGIN